MDNVFGANMVQNECDTPKKNKQLENDEGVE